MLPFFFPHQIDYAFCHFTKPFVTDRRSANMEDTIASNGWTSVPLDAAKIFRGGKCKEPDPVLVREIDFPEDALVERIQRYAKDKLPWETYNHSMRVFYFGQSASSPHHARQG